mmetsp:Transcript_20206/g.29973  ORF Transcript_20206/g.29973 Transcript_20206/m.29973 type:complete len:875 (-) Transcript_20206:1551-4175(-)
MEAGIDNIAMLQHQVNWEIGQEIVIITTAVKDSIEFHENEIRTVTAVAHNPTADVGAAVVLDSPVTYRHVANSGYQAEVGLLTRTIRIQGSESDSEPVDPDPLNCDGPCPGKELTGFGGHIMVHSGGIGKVAGVELYRMGQTNVMGRYPIHFHLLGDCPECSFTDSSVHRSYYRCISIHGTNNSTASENVAYDVRGFCYYLEDGAEQYNTLSFNLGAHIHIFVPTFENDPEEDGPDNPVRSGGQSIRTFTESEELLLPADIAASAFYITNIRNNIIGNAASGGWAGFAFPILFESLKPSQANFTDRPSMVQELSIDGNTAHSTGYWWSHGSAFYWGGSLYYNETTGVLTYNPGRDQGHPRRPCTVLKENDYRCWPWEYHWIRQTNSKAYLVKGAGLNSWTGRMEIDRFEVHDVSLGIESLESGFWIKELYAVCRTGEPLIGADRWMGGRAFRWYDTGQEHIITDSYFRNCGYRSAEYTEYDDSPDRGCGDEPDFGCHTASSVFTFLSHSDQFNPEIMQGTRNITFDNCGRRFSYSSSIDSVSGRTQNWLDQDGSVTGMTGRSVVASGYPSSGLWWTIDDHVHQDTHGPVQFLDMTLGPERDVGHIKLHFDAAQHNLVGKSEENGVCSNGRGKACVALGYARHLGPRFSDDPGLPITAQADIAGVVGGFGWLMTFLEGSPVQLNISMVELKPDTTMMLAIPYPTGVSFDITMYAAWCNPTSNLCEAQFISVDSIEEVRFGPGNLYHVDPSGVLWMRVIQTPQTHFGYVTGGDPLGWQMYDYDDLGAWGRNQPGFKLPRFERGGVLLPRVSNGPVLVIEVDCNPSSTNAAYCENKPADVNPDPCDVDGYTNQTAYDTCCAPNAPSDCVYASGEFSR